MRKLIRCVSLFLVACVLVAAGPAMAQSTTGSVYGTVTDSTGAVIPGASVTATEVSTGVAQTRTSNAAGEFTFPALNPGNYSVAAKVAGFQSVTQKGVVLSANQNVNTSFALQVGSTDTLVTVDAQTTLVDTREAQLAETIDERQIRELPLVNRDPYDLVQLVPGVTSYAADSQIGSRTGTQFSVNGLAPTTVSYYLDGTLDEAIYLNGGNILPNPDALQEFRLLTSTFDAEFGRSPGGALNVITRSGTAQFHGEGYDYLRNTSLNATPYFASKLQKQPIHQNQFGGNFGGPIPFARKQDFFFLSYEQLILHTPADTYSNEITTATALERMGNFTASPTSVQTAIKGKIVTCGNALIICSTALDPVAQNALKYVPVEASDYSGVPQQQAPADASANQGLARVDLQVTPAHQVEAMFFNSRGNQVTPKVGASKILDYGNFADYENQVNAVLADTWTISGTTLNTLRGFYEQNRYVITNLHQGQFLADLGSQAGEGGPIYGVPQFAINGYWTMGTSGQGPSNILQQSFGLIDTVNLTRGRHNIKLGGSLFYAKYGEAGGQLSNGVFTFTGAVTGNALADFLEGKAANLNQTTSQVHHSHNYDPALFAQDDWQVSKRLSLNVGVRWEMYSPFVGDPVIGTFIPGQQSAVVPLAPVGIVFPGDTRVPNGVFNTPLTSFAPRIGFAYDVYGNGKTSLRGGIGIFYDEQKELFTGNLQQSPYVLTLMTTRPTSLVTPYAGTPSKVDPFPYTYTPGAPNFPTGLTTVGTRPDGGTVPYAEEFNLTVEQQLGANLALRVGYVGNVARKGYIVHDENAPVYTPGAVATSTHVVDLRRPYEPYIAAGGFEFGQITITDPALNGSYHSLQATFRGKIGPSLQVFATYVFSKELDYEGPFVNGSNIKQNYGPGSIDQRNTFTASYIYQFPVVERFGAFGKQALSGWQLNGVTFLHSGTPFTVISGVDTNADGVTNDRVDIVGNPYNQTTSRSQRILNFLNPAAFAKPTGPYGNETNNQLTGPRVVQTNLSLFKNFTFTDRIRLQFRAEASNVIGNVNLGGPAVNLITLNTDLNTSKPQIGTAGAPRVVQLALKLMF